MRLPSLLPQLRRPLTAALATAVAGALAVALLVGFHQVTNGRATTVAANNPPTPGNFTGYGFDQCQAPSQAAMDTWLSTSPYLAAGIYIAGDSRGCRTQTYLNSTWVATQLAEGWHLLPITLGPQASCNAHFPRYGDDVKINGTPGTDKLYDAAAAQGTAEASKTVTAAQALGLVPGSTMYYDLESFTESNTRCRESALRFLSSWTVQLHKLGYLSGVYSSGGSGIKALDEARTGGVYVMPDQLWIADWDGQAGTSSTYVTAAAWQPDARVKQYAGGHNEKHGGVTINIDNDYLDVGHGSVAATENHCNGTSVDLAAYPIVRVGAKNDLTTLKALKCLLKEQGLYAGRVGPGAGKALLNGIHRFQELHGWPDLPGFAKRAWVALLSTGTHPIVKYGSAGADVRALQRALNAAEGDKLPVTGVFVGMTTTDLKAYQKKLKLPANGVANADTWAALAAGKS